MEFAEIIEKPRVDGVVLLRPLTAPVEGSLAITGHHLIFSPTSQNRSSTSSSNSNSNTNENDDVWVILHKNVDLVLIELQQRSQLQQQQSMNGSMSMSFTSSSSISAASSTIPFGVITLKCKNFLMVQLEFRLSLEDCQYVAKAVEILANLTNPIWHYPFFFQHSVDVRENGWEAFTVEQTFAALQMLTDKWRISYVNHDYAICPTYPSALIVPKLIGDDILRLSAQFREGGRFPVLSYYHKKTKSVVIRCSQPMVGVGNKRCREDEQLLNAMLSAANRGYILDTRSVNGAQTAKQKGGGFEPETSYPMWKRVHKPVQRWQALQESLAKLIDACNDYSITSDKWLSKLNNSGWLQNVNDILSAACVAAQCIDREGEKAGVRQPEDNLASEMSVVIHGGQSLDSTAQVVSLVQVILDPDCRTLRGFEALIEREWVLAGHPFATRCAHAAYARTRGDHATEGPTFLLFLDSVWQIYQQFPCSFEFTDQLLMYLFEHAYASEFGTFLCNNEKERRDLDIKTKTVSIWSHLNRPEVLHEYMNVFYEPNKAPVWPSVAPQSVVLWDKLYCKWTRNWTSTNGALDAIVQLRTEEKKAISKVSKMRRQLAELEREARAAGIELDNLENDGVAITA